jgi:hypothetical protein
MLGAWAKAVNRTWTKKLEKSTAASHLASASRNPRSSRTTIPVVALALGAFCAYNTIIRAGLLPVKHFVDLHGATWLLLAS